MADKRGISPSNIICTGDVVGYCAQPNECLSLIKKWGIHLIAGNVELQLANDEDACGCDFNAGSTCDTLSKNWYDYAKSSVKPVHLPFLKNLPEFITFTHNKTKYGVVHGSTTKTAEFIFKSSPWQVKQMSFDALSCRRILAGHCGLPFVDENEGLVWLNPGVIGMPANNGSTKVWYATIDANVHFHELTYDYKKAAHLMQSAALPVQYATTLKTGLWDNCDILPPEEANQQGLVLVV